MFRYDDLMISVRSGSESPACSCTVETKFTTEENEAAAVSLEQLRAELSAARS